MFRLDGEVFRLGTAICGNSLCLANPAAARVERAKAFRRGGQKNKARSEQETASGFKQQKPRDSLDSGKSATRLRQ
jgi:hypothetical protein